MRINRIQATDMKDYTAVRRHAHDTGWELHYFLSGEGRYVTERSDWQIPDGTILLTAPGEVHQIFRNASGRPFFFYYIQFNPSAEELALIKTVHARLSAPKNTDISVSHRYLFNEMTWKLNSNDAHLVESGTYQLLAFLHHLVSDRNPLSGNSGEHVQKALAVMHTAVQQGRAIDGSIAKKIGINDSYFERIFKRSTGLSPVKYFNKLRVERACLLLRETTFPVSRIAKETAFKDEFYFSRIFKQYIGCSPRSYRLRTMEEQL